MELTYVAVIVPGTEDVVLACSDRHLHALETSDLGRARSSRHLMRCVGGFVACGVRLRCCGLVAGGAVRGVRTARKRSSRVMVSVT